MDVWVCGCGVCGCGVCGCGVCECGVCVCGCGVCVCVYGWQLALAQQLADWISNFSLPVPKSLEAIKSRKK